MGEYLTRNNSVLCSYRQHHMGMSCLSHRGSHLASLRIALWTGAATKVLISP